MSIYCTLWELRFPGNGETFETDEDMGILVIAQSVPQHIQDVGERWDFLPPPRPITAYSSHYRAVVFITQFTDKGTERNGQEYKNPLFTVIGEIYERLTFDQLHDQICEALRKRQSITAF